MTAEEFFYSFIVFCTLVGAGGAMLADGNWVFGGLMMATAVYHVVRAAKAWRRY